MTNTLSKIEEAELVVLLKKQNEKGYNYLYDHYAPALYGIIIKIVKDTYVAEDILQETFEKIWKNIDQYNSSRGTLFTWILNIARNKAIDKTRSSTFKQGLQNRDLEKIVNYIDTKENSSLYVDGIGLNEILTKLKPDLYQVVKLLYLEGFTQAEASEALNIPLGTIKTRIKTALNHLRTVI